SVDPLPFFNQTAEENKENGSFQYMGSSEFTPDTLGVPTHFQNDGSLLYLLTHAFSPPSAAAVGQWLPQHTYSNSVSGYFNCGENVTDDQEIEHHPTSTPHAEALPLMANSPVPGSASEHTTTTFIDTVMMKSDQPNKENKKLDDWHDFSQISAEDEKHKLTPLSQIGFRDPASTGGGQQLTILSIEVFAESRAELRPDPRFDAINVVSLAVEDDGDNTVEVCVLIRGNNDKSQGRRLNLDGVIGCSVDVFPEERDLLNHLIDALCSIDPDILVGWEIQLGSLGFLAERAAYLGIGLLKRISRTLPHESKHPPKNLAHESSQVPEASPADDVIMDVSENDWSHTHASGVHVGGRIVLNLWRLMRGEVKLNNYSLEAVADEVLRRKVPLVPNKTLNRWFATGPGRGRHRCIEYVSSRAMLNLEIINQLD
uniref:DNA-directed DNA polymerase family B exonuclease domain-containing protein n=1 Tax=Aegilops tauschii subsp. strangulata TaxID=200361 RepID=A0A453AR94_AEGTS